MGLSINMNKNGIKAHQTALNAISNNIANATTEGYKAKSVRFRTLMANPVTEDDVLLNGVDPQINAGATSDVAITDYSQGTLNRGVSQLSLATTGEGFFAVENNAGDLFLTKDGSFTVDGAGRLVNGNGHYLMMDGALPANTGGNQVSISNTGAISVDNVAVGQVQIYVPDNPETLQPAGSNYFVDPTGALTLVDDATIEANMLEMSNVDLAQELTNMIVTQRAYSLNVKVAQSTDEMMSLINQTNV